MGNISGDALRGHLETMVLSALERGETHGFDILRRLEAAGCGALRLKEGTLYPVLYRLENAGLLRGVWESADSGRRGPRRRVYHLTKKGTRQLALGREGWKTFVSVIGRIVEAPA
jgi:PadR family transcriptional regulator, regulatory protein PadR